MDGLVGRVNGKYGKTDYCPIQYVKKKLHHRRDLAPRFAFLIVLDQGQWGAGQLSLCPQCTQGITDGSYYLVAFMFRSVFSVARFLARSRVLGIFVLVQ